MRLYHVTPMRNLTSIGREGIDPGYSRGARKECWFCTAGKLAWAMIHVSKRHRVSVDDVIALEVLIPAREVTNRGRGLYACPVVINPLFIVETLDAFDVAGSVPFVTPQ